VWRFVRILWNAATVVSAVLCVSLLTLLCRSYQRPDGIELVGYYSIEFTSNRGQFLCVRRDAVLETYAYTTARLDRRGALLARQPIDFARWVNHGISIGGFHWLVGNTQLRSPRGDRESNMSSINIGDRMVTDRILRTRWIRFSAVWPIVATGLLPLARLAGYWFRRRSKPGDGCAECGYDLRTTPERCPECGAVARTIKAQ
jgi:hypothetical protein